MKRWKIVVETKKGKFLNRYTRADNLDEASGQIRSKIPVTWRIVSVQEVYE